MKADESLTFSIKLEGGFLSEGALTQAEQAPGPAPMRTPRPSGAQDPPPLTPHPLGRARFLGDAASAQGSRAPEWDVQRRLQERGGDGGRSFAP